MYHEDNCRYSIEQMIKQISRKNFPSAFLTDFIPLTGGVANTTYLLSLSDGKRIVVHIAPNPEKLFSYEKHLFRAAEQASYICRKNGIPTPEILCVDDSLMCIDRHYMLSVYIPALSLHQIDLPEEVKASCFENAGRTIRKLHQITGSHFGRLAMMTYKPGFSTWAEAMIHEVQEWKNQALPASLLPADYYPTIDSIFQAHVPILNQITIPHLVHGDLWQGNILANTDGKSCHFKAIIDLGQTLWGDPEYDFSGKMMNDAFSEGYGKRLSEYEEDKYSFIRRKLYLLYYSLKQCYKYKCLFKEDAKAHKQRHYVDLLLYEFS